MAETWDLIRAEREDLLAMCKTLTPEQWDAQTLCTRWKTRHIVAHLIEATRVQIGPFLVGMATSGFKFNNWMAKEGIAKGDRPTADLIADLESIIPLEKTPPGAKPEDLLVDTLTHQQDIRRPLGLPRDIPEERLRAAADRAKGYGWPMQTKKAIAGLKLRATDADWSTGEGPEVTGPLEALLLAMVKRPAALADLSGPGKDTLAARIS